MATNRPMFARCEPDSAVERRSEWRDRIIRLGWLVTESSASITRLKSHGRRSGSWFGTGFPLTETDANHGSRPHQSTGCSALHALEGHPVFRKPNPLGRLLCQHGADFTHGIEHPRSPLLCGGFDVRRQAGTTRKARWSFHCGPAPRRSSSTATAPPRSGNGGVTWS